LLTNSKSRIKRVGRKMIAKTSILKIIRNSIKFNFL
jgi:hypothetical protein